MTRRITMLGVALMLAALISLDLATSAPLDPFHVPRLIALGSGQSSGGAICAALPPGQ
ncbi:MAG: hypothetical protein COW55_14310 [Rhodobacteraceae bacterium CG17_big_fil_post_rev_8_21_14_2_50_65_11]|nr:MAG: hypothetical protein COW55_14310 [Rhodobacteraceae bacterium CG17_big_fil_post_rev_8_21_14_2_50_65_11]